MMGNPSGESGSESELTVYASFRTAGGLPKQAAGQCST